MIRFPIRLSKSHPSHPALPITFHRVLLTPYSFSLSIFNSIPPRCSLIYRSSLSFSFSIFSIRISFYPGEVSHPSGNVFPFPFSHYSPRNNSNRNLISQLFRDPVISESVNRTKIKCEEYRRKLEKRKYLSIKRRRRWRRSIFPLIRIFRIIVLFFFLSPIFITSFQRRSWRQRNGRINPPARNENPISFELGPSNAAKSPRLCHG